MNRRAPAPPPKSSSTTGRTVVLVAVASAAAAFILGRGFANNKSPSTSNGGTKTTTTVKPGTKGATTLPSASTTLVTLPPTIAPSAIKVLVLNGNGIAGTAGKRSTELGSLGYQSTATDAVAALKNSATSAIYFTDATYQAAAAALATKIGVAAAAAPMPATDIVDKTKLTGINIVVLLGKDLAEKPIAGATPATTVAASTATTAAKVTTATTKA
jgi:LytR cell envelope-related transcriptional attenuator